MSSSERNWRGDLEIIREPHQQHSDIRHVTIGVFGDSGAGKTTIIHRLLSGEYEEPHHTPDAREKLLSSIVQSTDLPKVLANIVLEYALQPTTTKFPVKVHTPLHSIYPGTDQSCLVDIWDMAGNEECQPVWKNYAKMCQICLLVVDVSKVAEEKIEPNIGVHPIVSMASELATAMQDAGSYNTQLIVVFTKMDLIDKTENQEKFKRVSRVSKYIQNFLCPLGVRRVHVSAKTGWRIEVTFLSVI